MSDGSLVARLGGLRLFLGIVSLVFVVAPKMLGSVHRTTATERTKEKKRRETCQVRASSLLCTYNYRLLSSTSRRDEWQEGGWWFSPRKAWGWGGVSMSLLLDWFWVSPQRASGLKDSGPEEAVPVVLEPVWSGENLHPFTRRRKASDCDWPCGCRGRSLGCCWLTRGSPCFWSATRSRRAPWRNGRPPSPWWTPCWWRWVRAPCSSSRGCAGSAPRSQGRRLCWLKRDKSLSYYSDTKRKKKWLIHSRSVFTATVFRSLETFTPLFPAFYGFISNPSLHFYC